jgi:hypothetical protein
MENEMWSQNGLEWWIRNPKFLDFSGNKVEMGQSLLWHCKKELRFLTP